LGKDGIRVEGKGRGKNGRGRVKERGDKERSGKG